MTFEIVGSTTLCAAGFLELDRVDVRAPDGAVLERHVVRHPGAVVVVPLTDDGDVLMVRQYRTAIGGTLLEVPAGKRDVDGEAPEATAARELEEEIGYRAGALQPLCEFYNSPGFTDEYTHVFLATGLELTRRAAVSAEEAAMSIERVALADVDALIADGSLVDAKSIIGVLTARARLQGARASRARPRAERRRPMAGDDTLDGLLDEYDTWLRVERGLAPNSLAAYRRDLARYADYLRRHGETSPGAVSEATVARYVDELRGARRDDGRARYAPASVARAVAAVHSFHRFCLEEGVVAADPSEDVGAPRVPQGIPKALTEAEVESLLHAVVGDAPRALRDRAILETLYAGGVRISELVGLDRADLDLRDGLARVLGKGNKERVVPIGRGARDALDDYLEHGRPELDRGIRATRSSARVGDAVFLNARGGRLTRQGAWLIVRAAGGRAGLGDRLYPHVLRHSCATHMLDHGADIRVVQELLGHASLSTTQVYTRVSPERLRAVYDLAHPRANAAARSAPGPATAEGRDLGGVCTVRCTAGSRATRRYTSPMPETSDTVLRDQLQEERERLRDQLRRLGHGSDAALDFDENFADSGQVTAERGEVEALAGQLEETLLEIEEALAKFEAGSYGECESCHQRIGEARLEAMPAARLCIECASQRR